MAAKSVAPIHDVYVSIHINVLDSLLPTENVHTLSNFNDLEQYNFSVHIIAELRL